MKINQIVTESKKIDEAPVGAFTQLGRKLGSRVLNKVGAKATAQNLAGKADLGATANKLFQQYNNYLGRLNKSVKQSTGTDLKNFLATKNVAVNVPSGPIDPARLDKMFLKVARDAMSKKTRPVNPPAGSGTPPANPPGGTPPAGGGNKRTTMAQVAPLVKGLRKRDKQSLLAQLQKELGKGTP